VATFVTSTDVGLGYDMLVQRRRSQRRSRTAAVIIITAVIAGSALAVTPAADAPITPASGAATNGWVAFDALRGGGDIYLVRPGEGALRLEVAGSDAANEACPAWSPDGERLLFGRVSEASGTPSSDAELVIVPVGQNGAAGSATVIDLDGFDVLEGFEPHPCGIWAPDGRWVAFGGAGEVWVVDTQTGTIRRLPDLRPSDLEWRPGTDQLTIAGDMGANRSAPTLSTPVTVYSVSTGELRRLGSDKAAHITWSPDGTTLAYTGGEADGPHLHLVDADGANERLLDSDIGEANQGVGPVWSPAGDRIAYQRLIVGRAEAHEVVLVNVADGTETVIAPPVTGGPDGLAWYPYDVTWSPDGTMLLYTAWPEGGPPGSTGYAGQIVVPADTPSDVTIVNDEIRLGPDADYSHRWAIQMWGRQPG